MSVFLRGSMRSSKYIIKRRLQSANILSVQDQGQVFHSLFYILDSDEYWGTARDLILVSAPDMEQAGHREVWMERVNQGITRSYALKDLMTKAWLHIYLGELYQYQAQYQQARTQFESSIAYFGKENKIQEHGRSLISLGNVARLERSFDEATQLIQEGFELAGHIKEEELHSYIVQSVMALDVYDWNKAKYFAEKSLVLAREIHDRRMEAWSLNNLLLASWGRKEYKLAIACYEEAIKLFKIVTDPVHEALVKMNMGIVYVELNQLDEALEFYLTAESIFSQRQDWAYVAMVNNNLGMAYHQLKEWNKAEDSYNVCMNQWKRLSNIRELVNVMDNLGLLYLAQTFYDRAIQVFSEALSLLNHIQHDPNYDFFFKMVSENLHSAKEQKIAAL